MATESLAALYCDLETGETARVAHPALAAPGGRRRARLERLDEAPLEHGEDPLERLGPSDAGVVLPLHRGLPHRAHLVLAHRALRRHLGVWMHWPREGAIEPVDRGRLRALAAQWVIWRAVRAGRQIVRARRLLATRGRRIGRAAAPRATRSELRASERWRRPLRALRQIVRWTASASGRSELGWLATGCERTARDLEALRARPRAVRPRGSGDRPFAGRGVYLRLDFWAPLASGGSYGHTCYLARELARASDGFLCFTANRFTLLDELGVRQVVVPAPSGTWRESDVLRSGEACVRALRPALEALSPDFVYERIVPGNAAGARVCRDLGIPYIVEYNGSEIVMNRSFGERALVCEELYLAAEGASFAQATLISVVSDPIRDDLVARGIEPERIVVLPNGVDPLDYAPPERAERAAIRKELEWDDSHRVIGFSATFGGWHGVDVLAALIPRVCARCPDARFLLIGDGPMRPLVDRVVREHGLSDRVRSLGSVPQREGARWLRACDVFVSPHSRRMESGRFFGSPTKVFEFMALGGGIVAADLEQIGEVLSPALRVQDLRRGADVAVGERAVLCRPGDVDEFVEALVALVESPEHCEALGANAREAALRDHTWARHVERLGSAFAARASAAPVEVSGSAVSASDAPGPPLLAVGDPDKREIQRQWNADPCGSQFGNAEPGTLSWYREVERHRYEEYAPWMPELMEFERHAGEEVLEIGAGLGTDLARFAASGARVTDVDLAAAHLEHARRNFALRGLEGRFVHHDGEVLPFPDGRFDLVYTHGVLHHTPDAARMVSEIRRVLRPGGRVIAMVYARDSLHYWVRLFAGIGLREDALAERSMGDILADVELGASGAKPLVAVYGRRALRERFAEFADVRIHQRQLTLRERPSLLRWLPLDWVERSLGWNLIVKARKPETP